MAGSFGILTLFLALLSGGANDLLDFASTDAYWKAKNVTVSVEQLTNDIKPPAAADLSKLIKSLGSGSYAEREEATKKLLAQGTAALADLEKGAHDPDPEVSNRSRLLTQQIRVNSKATDVRRLMAIRTLGERKEASALPALRALLTSREMFVSDYAARAIARIENKPIPPRQATEAAELKADLAMLPANCAIVGQLAVDPAKSVSLDEVLKTFPLPPGEERAELVAQLNAKVIELADQVGNVRFEGVSFGVSDNVGANEGFTAAVVHGQYDSRAVNAYLAKQGFATQTIAGVSVISPEADAAIAFPSDSRAILSSAASADKLPVKELLANFAKPAEVHPVLKGPEFAPFLASLKGDTRMWAVCKVSDSYRAAPVIQPFDHLTLVGREEKNKVSLRIAGSGKDPAQVKSAVDQVNQSLAEAKNQLPQAAKQIPALKPIADFAGTLQCVADGKNAELTGALDGGPGSLLSVPMMFGAPMGGNAQPVAQPPPPPAPVKQEVAPKGKAVDK
jgi:hypothetical protein